jgi:hypothetical protein
MVVAKEKSFSSVMMLRKDLNLENLNKECNQFRPHSSLRYLPPQFGPSKRPSGPWHQPSLQSLELQILTAFLPFID